MEPWYDKAFFWPWAAEPDIDEEDDEEEVR